MRYNTLSTVPPQLVAMCRGESPGQGEMCEDLAELRRQDPGKWARLAARLVTPARGSGPCPAPATTGAAEFFQDFILSCRSPQLVRHLRDQLATEVGRLDGLELEPGEGWEEGTDPALLDRTQDALTTARYK